MVGQTVGGVKIFHVPQLGKIKMDEIAMDAASLVMLYVKRTIHRRHITRPQLPQMSTVPDGVLTVGVLRMKE